jgi:hypothetical protein
MVNNDNHLPPESKMADTDFWEEGLAKYLRLTQLMARLPWGFWKDPFQVTGDSLGDWASRPSNLARVVVGWHGDGCWGLKQQPNLGLDAECPPT